MASRPMREFETGANRDQNTDKINYAGHLSSLVLKKYSEYMHSCRKLPDGSIRAADNWKSGIPKQAYIESLARHVEDVMLVWEGHPEEAVEPEMTRALCATIFNAQGLLYEILMERKGRR